MRVHCLLQRVYLKLHQWGHLRLRCWRSRAADGRRAPDSGLFTRVLSGRQSRSVTRSSEPCHLESLHRQEKPAQWWRVTVALYISSRSHLVSRSGPDEGWANGGLPTPRLICSGACIMKRREPSLGITRVILDHKVGLLSTGADGNLRCMAKLVY